VSHQQRRVDDEDVIETHEMTKATPLGRFRMVGDQLFCGSGAATGLISKTGGLALSQARSGLAGASSTGYVVAVAEAHEPVNGVEVLEDAVSSVVSVWSKYGLENDDRLPLRNALVDLVGVDGHVAPARGGPRACATPTREPAGTSAAACVLDIEGEGDAPHLVSAGMLLVGCSEVSSGSAWFALHEFENGLDVGGCGDSLSAVAVVADSEVGVRCGVLLPPIPAIPATGERVFDG
jgi:hypothetical protein